MVWVTAFVHLGTGLLWSWCLGPGTADERLHLCQLLNTLPTQALIIADAAYMGYELAWEILRASDHFSCGCRRRTIFIPWRKRC